MERFVLLLVALVVTVRAGPVLRNSMDACSNQCTENSKFNYVAGRTYEYAYNMDTTTSVQGASEDHAGIHMAAAVHVEILSKCELSMRLSDVTLTEYDPRDAVMKDVSVDFHGPLEKSPLRISYQDGRIESLCLADDEPNWVLNIKRGILSTFQNQMDDFTKNQTVTETDVSGNCETVYTVDPDTWHSKNVRKSKNLLGCTERSGFNTAVQAVPYTADSAIQSMPLIKSSHECQHEIDSQSLHVVTARCNEQHVFRPFSRQDSGVVTHVKQELTFLQHTSGTRSPTPTMRIVSLKFEHANDPDQETRTRKDLERKLMEICEDTKTGVSEKTPRLFTDLVYMMKSADTRTLSDTDSRLNEGSICSENKERVGKFFRDALPVVGTRASLSLMTKLLTSKVVTGVEASMWLTSLAFIKNPTRDMLAEVKPLVNMVDNEEKAMLSVGSLLHSYCRVSSGCESDDTVRAIISAMENKIARGCKVTPANFKTTLIALRAIGNAGYAQSAIPTLQVCLRVKTTPLEIRLSAIEAYRRMSCNSDKSQIMSTYLDKEEDSELRIAAYKALMECPSADILTQIKNTLETEEINQVGSYVWSHLTNLMETSDRHKQDIRAILEDEVLGKEFDLDKKKFSRNYEGSIFVEKLNTGAKLEGDLIWSSKSFIPRSGMMNFTVDLFGHSINFLELGGRAEGLEYFLENMFGPSGYFSKPEPETKNPTTGKLIKPDKMSRIDKRFEQHIDQLKGSLYMRVFGNELRYMNFHGLDALMAGPNFNFLELMIQLSQENENTFTQSMMFLDSSMIIPTGAGFPMNLTVNGTAVVDLKLKGKMDMRAPPTVDIDALIHPSAAIDISSMMSVDAFVTKSGIKMVSSLHSNSAVRGKLHVNEAGVLTAEYELPQPRMDIISAKSSFFTVHRNMEKEQKMLTENRRPESICTPAKLVTVTGLELCAEVNYPNASQISSAPYFPLTGPVSAGVYLYNRDTHTKYRMVVKSSHTKNNNILHFTFNTPGSVTDRNIVVDFNLDKGSHTLGMSLTSPWKKANFQGAVANTRKMTSLNGKLNIDGTPEYAVNAQMLRERVGKGYKYSPSLELSIPTYKEPLSIYASLQHNGIQTVDVEYSMSGFTLMPMSAQASLTNKRDKYGLKGNLVVEKNKEYSFDAHISKQTLRKKMTYTPLISVRTPTAEVFLFGGTVTNVYNKKIDVNLSLDKIFAKKASLKGNIQKINRRKNRVIYSTRMNFESIPADFDLVAKIDNRNSLTIATDIAFAYNIRRVSRNKISLVSKITNLSSTSLTKGKGSLNFAVNKNPEYNLKLISNLDHSLRQTEADIDLRYGADYSDENKHILFSGSMHRNFKSYSAVSADVQTKLRHQGIGLNVVLKGNHKHDRQASDSSFLLRTGRGKPIQMNLRLRDKTETLLKICSEFDISYPGREIAFNNTFEQLNEKKYVNTFNSQLQKGQKNSIITAISTPHDDGMLVTSDILLHGRTPTKLKGEWNLDPMDLLVSTSYEKDSGKYAASTSWVTQANKQRVLTTDIQYPTRRVILTLDEKMMPNLYSSEMILRWNAGRNETEKMILSGWAQPISATKVNGSLSLSYPSRKLTLNMHHVTSKKYTTHADFSWAPEKKISVDSLFGRKRRGAIGLLKFSTPFKPFTSLNIDIRHQNDNDEYRTDVTANWDPKEMVATTVIVRKPLSFKTIVGSVALRSTKKLFKKMKLDLDHKLSSSLDSSIKLAWNRWFVNTDITLMNTTKGRRVGGKGDISVQTSFPYMKKGTVSVSHECDGKTLNTIVKILRNKKSYTMNSKITHALTTNGFDSTGKVDMSTPVGDILTNWNHRNTRSDMASTITTAWGKKLGKQITVRVNGDHNLALAEGTLNAAISFQSPFQVARDVAFQLAHTHRNKFLDSVVKLTNDGKKIGSAEATLTISPVSLDTGVSILIPKFDVDSYIKATGHATPGEPLSLVVDCVITHDISSTLELQQHAKIGDRLSSLKTKSMAVWKSTYPGFEQVAYTYEVEADESLSTKSKLEYGSGKVIELLTKLKMTDKEGIGFVSLTTPFANFTRMQGEVSILGDMDTFTSDIYLEILPRLKRMSVSASWDTTDGLTSKLRVDTPFREVPYFQVLVDVKDENQITDGSIMIEYLPRKTVRLDAMYNHNDPNIVDVSSHITSPFVTSSISLKGNHQSFKSRVEIERYGLDIGFSNGNKIEGSATVSIPGRRDIVGMFSHTGTASNFACHAEILHNRKNQFTSDLLFTLEKVLSLSASASLNMQMISDEVYQIGFKHDGQPTNFKSHAEFTTSIGKSETDIALDLTHDIQGSLSVKSVPFAKDIESSFSHHQRARYLQSRMELLHGGEKMVDILAVINAEKSFVSELSITSPLSEDIQLRVRVDGEPMNFAFHTEGSLGVLKSEIDISSHIGTNYLQELATFRGTSLPDITAEISHSGPMDDFRSYTLLTVGRDTHRVDATVSARTDTDAIISLSSPLVDPVTAKFSVQGPKDNFNSRAELNIGNDRSEVDVSFSISPRVQGSISLNTPYWMDMSAGFDHTGQFPNIMSHVQIQYEGYDKFDVVVTASTENLISGSVTISTPIKDFETIRSSFAHEGVLRNFKCHAEFAIADNKTEADIYYSSQNSYEGLISARSHHFPEVSVGFEHSGTNTTFKSHVEFSYALKKAEADISVNVAKDIDTSLRIRYPMMEEISATFTHRGQINDFHSHAELKKGSHSESVDITYSNTNKINGELAINNGLIRKFATEDFGDVAISFDHSGEPTNFNSHVGYIAGRAKADGDLRFSVANNILVSSVTIKSPLTDDISINVRHNGELSDFQTHGDIAIGFKKGECDIALNVKDIVDGSFSVNAPDFSLNIRHSGKLTSFNTHADIRVDGVRREADISLNIDNDITFKFTAPAIELNMKHTGNRMNFKCHGDIMIDNIERSVDLSTAVTDSAKEVATILNIRAPEMTLNVDFTGNLVNFTYHSDIRPSGNSKQTLDIALTVGNEIDWSFKMLASELELNMNHFGKFPNFRSHADITKGSTKCESSVSLSVTEIVDASFTASSPGFSMVLGHSGRLSSFRSHGDVTIGDDSLNSELALTVGDSVDGTFFIMLPERSVRINHQGKLTDFKSTIELKNVSDHYTAEVQLRMKPRIEARLTISTPVSGYESLKAIYTHDGEMTNFNCHGEIAVPNSVSIADLKVNVHNLQDMDVSLSVSSPEVPDFVMEVDHSRSRSSYRSRAELSIDREVVYGLVVTYNNNSELNGELQITTPFNGYRQIRLASKHEGDVKQFRTTTVLDVGNDKNEVTVMFDSEPRLDGSVNIKSAYFPNVKYDISYSGQLSNFYARSELGIGGEKKASVEGSLNIEHGIQTSFALITPLENYTSMDMEFSHIGGISDFQTTCVVKLEGKKLIDTSVSFTNADKISGEAVLRSSYLPPLHVNLEHSGELMDFTASGHITNDGQKILTTSMEFNLKTHPFQSTGAITINGVSAKYSIEGKPNNFKAHSEINLESDLYSGDIAFAYKLEDIDASFSLKLPRKEVIQGSVSHMNRPWKWTTHATFSPDTSSKYDYDAVMKFRRGLEGTFSVKTPLEGYKESKLEFAYDGSFPNIQSDVKVSYGNKDIHVSGNLNNAASTTGSLSFNSPFEGYENIKLRFYREGDLTNFQTGGTLLYNGEAFETGLEHSFSGHSLHCRFHMMSPYTDEILISVNHTGVPTDFTTDTLISTGPDTRVRTETRFLTRQQYISLVSTTTTTMTGETFTQKAEFKHEGNLQNFKTEAGLSGLGSDIWFESSFHLRPVVEGSVSLRTPFRNFEDTSAGFSYSGTTTAFRSSAHVQYAQMKKIEAEIDVLQHGLRRMVTTVELRTPFPGYAYSKVTYQHNGDSNSFQCEADITASNKKMSTMFRASKSPLRMALNMRTPFRGYETIALTAHLDLENMEKYTSHVEASWNPTRRIVIDGSLSVHNRTSRVQGGASITTSFDILRRAAFDFSHQKISDKYMESVKCMYNGQSIVDVEVDHSLMNTRKSAVVTVRAPQPMKFELTGDFMITRVDTSLTANWNTDSSDSYLLSEIGYDLRTGHDKLAKFKLTRPDQEISYSGLLAGSHSRSLLQWGIGSTGRAGYDVTINSNDITAKLILPSRSLKVTGSHRGRVTDGSFLWDADVDQTRKIGFHSLVLPSDASFKADITLMLPTLGRNVQLGSEMVVNRGRVIFDGKTEFSYSNDERKKIVIASRLEDISSGSSSKNYSFSLGMSHPYSTIGIKLASHIGKSPSVYSGGIGLEYLTARRQTKTFNVNGQLNRIRKTISFELQSPVKSISISGSAQTDNKFRLSLLNVYDQHTPLTTVFTVDPTTRSIDFVMNYDLDNPRSEFHINAKYVNSSAVAAEVYHVVHHERVSDVIVATRLNTSHLLHSRLHWRPDMSLDLQALRQRKLDSYYPRVKAAISDVEEKLEEELFGKAELIYKAIEEEIGAENTARINIALTPVLEYGAKVSDRMYKLYARNAYSAANFTRNSYKNLATKYGQLRANYGLQSMDFTYLTNPSAPVKYVFETIQQPVRRLPSRVVEVLKSRTGNYIPQAIGRQFGKVDSFLGVETSVESAIESFLVWMLHGVEKDIEELMTLVSIKSPITVYDPAHGEIQAEFKLPIPVTSLDILPVVDMSRYVNKVMKYIPRDIKPSKYYPDLSGPWIPPFEAVATVEKGHRITTFDGYTYDLPMDCTFVLVRDYRDGNFSVVLTNKYPSTVIVLSRGTAIEISQTGDITVNGELATLPFRQHNTTISLLDEGLIEVDSATGYTVIYDTTLDHLTVKINGWYHGKTGGLFGIYDNEPSNDMMTSFNKVIDSPKRFARTWDVGTSQCR